MTKFRMTTFWYVPYTATIFPAMNIFIENLVEINFQKRNVSFIENGSWVPSAKKVMIQKLEKFKIMLNKV